MYTHNTTVTLFNLIALFPEFFTASEYDAARAKYPVLPALATAKKYALIYPIHAEVKWMQDGDGYPVKAWRYYYKVNY